MNTSFARYVLPMALACLSACGGGGSDSSTSTTPAADTPALKSIVVTPTTTTLAVGTSQQMTATGTYADGKTAAITSGITWSAKGTTVLSIFTSGLVTAKAAGTETVTAKVGDISGTATVTVTGPYKTVATGGGHSLAVKADGSLVAWGLNRSGQLGDGSAVDKATPTTIGSLKTWSVLAAGEYHTAALLGTNCASTGCPLYTWGFNQNGQLGYGSADSATPTKVGTVTTWVSVAAGTSHTLAVKKDGTLWAWGRNFSGQLGDGTQLDKVVPTQIGTLKTWKAVAAGAEHSMAMMTNGDTYTWGPRISGQTGQGDAAIVKYDLAPIKLALPPNYSTAVQFVAIAAGYNHSLAIRNNGTLWAWGDNQYGQLGGTSGLGTQCPFGGTTTFDCEVDLIQVVIDASLGLDNDWVAISAGLGHSLAIKSDGSLWAWGYNEYGQVGNGNTSQQSTPVRIGTDRDWVSVSAGKYHSFAIKADGTLWGWGRNAEGQLGNGASGAAATSVLVPTKLN